MRPMRGMLWRVEDEPAPIEKDFEPGVVIHWSRTIGVTRRNVHAAAQSDGAMGEVAANAHPLLVGFIGSAGGAGILIAERQMLQTKSQIGSTQRQPRN